MIPFNKPFLGGKETQYIEEASDKADIIVYLVAHNEFKTLTLAPDKVVLDFCGIIR